MLKSRRKYLQLHASHGNWFNYVGHERISKFILSWYRTQVLLNLCCTLFLITFLHSSYKIFLFCSFTFWTVFKWFTSHFAHFTNFVFVVSFSDWLLNWRRPPPIKLMYSKRTWTTKWKTSCPDSKICNSSPANQWIVMVWSLFANTVTSMVYQRLCLCSSNMVLKKRNSKIHNSHTTITSK